MAISDFYFDDPVDETPARRTRAPRILAAILLLAVGSIFLKTTLAANIVINTGVAVEFGQGVAATTACSGSSVLTITPLRSFA